MKIIRNKIFETNSSSTHSFTLCHRDIDFNLPRHICPSWESEFGWSFETWKSAEEKLAYMLRCFVSRDGVEYSNDEEKYLQNIHNTLKPYQERLKTLGITFDLPTLYEWDGGYVDHGDEYAEDLQDFYDNDEELLKFLLNEESYIEGGNDNV